MLQFDLFMNKLYCAIQTPTSMATFLFLFPDANEVYFGCSLLDLKTVYNLPG